MLAKLALPNKLGSEIQRSHPQLLKTITKKEDRYIIKWS